VSAFKPHRMALTTWALLGCAAAAQAQPATPNNLDEPISRLLPLQEGDVPPQEQPVCMTEVFSTAGETLLTVVDRSDAYARFMALPATDSTAAVPEQMTQMLIPSRRSSGWGGYTVEIKGKPNNEPRWAQNAYLLTLKVSDKRPCPGDAGPACYVYQGTLDQAYRLGRRSDYQQPTISAPQQRITLRERCAKDLYTWRGLFEVPGILDFIGGMFLNGR